MARQSFRSSVPFLVRSRPPSSRSTSMSAPSSASVPKPSGLKLDRAVGPGQRGSFARSVLEPSAKHGRCDVDLYHQGPRMLEGCPAQLDQRFRSSARSSRSPQCRKPAGRAPRSHRHRPRRRSSDRRPSGADRTHVRHPAGPGRRPSRAPSLVLDGDGQQAAAGLGPTQAPARWAGMEGHATLRSSFWIEPFSLNTIVRSSGRYTQGSGPDLA